jgi:hypothetical protein
LPRHTVRPYQSGDRSAVFEVLRAVWGTSTASGLEALWEWKVERGPCVSERAAPTLVLEGEGGIQGLMSAIAVNLKVHERVVPATYMCDFVTHPECRGTGQLLARRFMKMPTVLLGAPGPVAHQLSIRMGFAQPSMLDSHVRIVRGDRVLRSKTRYAALAAAGGWLWKAAGGVSARFRRIGSDAGVTVRALDHFDERFDALWRRVAPDYPVTVVRDSPYLTWRFVDTPERCYRFAVAERAGEVEGYVVFCSRPREGLVYGHVVDFLVGRRNPGARDALLSYATERLEVMGVDLVTSYACSRDAFFGEGFKRCGFPFSKPKRPIIAWDGTGVVGATTLARAEDWFFTRGDSDIDMEGEPARSRVASPTPPVE